MDTEKTPEPREDGFNTTSKPSAKPSREQQWREIVSQPPQLLPVQSIPAPVTPAPVTPTQVIPVPKPTLPTEEEPIPQSQISAPVSGPEYTHTRRWILILFVTALLILLSQGVAGDPSTSINVNDVLQR